MVKIFYSILLMKCHYHVCHDLPVMAGLARSLLPLLTFYLSKFGSGAGCVGFVYQTNNGTSTNFCSSGIMNDLYTQDKLPGTKIVECGQFIFQKCNEDKL